MGEREAIEAWWRAWAIEAAETNLMFTRTAPWRVFKRRRIKRRFSHLWKTARTLVPDGIELQSISYLAAWDRLHEEQFNPNNERRGRNGR